ncbi:phage repressor protein CI [Enterobacter sichuanensis]|uniref:phage repressor protein CI n=1 Tax=Enterobacter sichuanensis TaxID=2071710 RepID=UPI002B2117CA|nr:phage repressor protein CI [Enterobacter sichuanensis]MEA5170574.1 phage repressor protein CI [Enterobacter sichuanensis]
MSIPTDSFDPLAILDRLCLVYGYAQKIQLANHFSMSASSLSNRYTRGNVSYDLVVQCALETGANLKWLMTGEGESFSSEEDHTDKKNGPIQLEKFTLCEGELVRDGDFYLDALALEELNPDVYCLDAEDVFYIVERNPLLIDGHKLLGIDGYVSIRSVQMLPGKQIKVYGGKEPFTCSVNDVEVLGHIAKVIVKLED